MTTNKVNILIYPSHTIATKEVHNLRFPLFEFNLASEKLVITSIWSNRSSPEGSNFFIDAFKFIVDQLGKVGCGKKSNKENDIQDCKSETDLFVPKGDKYNLTASP